MKRGQTRHGGHGQLSATPPIPGRGQKGQLSLLGGDGLDMPEFLQRKPQVHYRPAEAAENPPAEEAAEPDNCRTQRPTEERGAGDVPGEPLPAPVNERPKTGNAAAVAKPDFKPQQYAGTQCPCFTGERRARRARVSCSASPGAVTGASTGARACVISGRPWVVPRGEI